MELLLSTKGNLQLLPRTRFLLHHSARRLVPSVEPFSPPVLLGLQVRILFWCLPPAWLIIGFQVRPPEPPLLNQPERYAVSPLRSLAISLLIFLATETQNSNSGAKNSGSSVRYGLEFIGLGSFTLFMGWIVVMTL